jgi:hypothetical protein
VVKHIASGVALAATKATPSVAPVSVGAKLIVNGLVRMRLVRLLTVVVLHLQSSDQQSARRQLMVKFASTSVILGLAYQGLKLGCAVLLENGQAPQQLVRQKTVASWVA